MHLGPISVLKSMQVDSFSYVERCVVTGPLVISLQYWCLGLQLTQPPLSHTKFIYLNRSFFHQKYRISPYFIENNYSMYSIKVNYIHILISKSQYPDAPCL